MSWTLVLGLAVPVLILILVQAVRSFRKSASSPAGAAPSQAEEAASGGAASAKPAKPASASPVPRSPAPAPSAPPPAAPSAPSAPPTRGKPSRSRPVQVPSPGDGKLDGIGDTDPGGGLLGHDPRDFEAKAGSAPPETGSEPESGATAPAPVTDVHVSTAAPAAVRPGDRFFVHVFFHVEGIEIEVGEDQVVDRDVANLPVAAGTRLTVRVVPVDAGTFEIDQDEDSCVWQPPVRQLDFRLRALEDLPDGLQDLRLEIWCGQVQLDRWYLSVEINAAAAPQRRSRPKVHQRLPRSAFASYSRKDKARVADRVEALKAVGVDVFLDCLDIRQGEDWQQVLERELLSRDRTLLFWSAAASDSTWVEKEWRYALEHRGLEHILPNALEPPDSCPPPKELASLQFGSVLTELRRAWQGG